jgi:2-polyprenyl-6-methoxyphenol hydroxylase-like FAD-dependent oxidoreductase
MYDAIVIGARCGGSPTAMLLARLGYSVLLIDRGGFPSDTISTHYIHQPGVERLARWGLLDRVIASGCPPVRNQTFDVGPFALHGAPPPVDGIADGYAPRRTVLDSILVEAAVAAGAELREHFPVRELVTDGDRVVGIRGLSPAGKAIAEKARIVIGADGLHSLVARSVHAADYEVRPTFSCAYYSYWGGVPVDGAELYPRPQRMIIAAPTNAGQTLVIVYWPQSEFHRVRGAIEGEFMEALDLVPDLSERVRAGERSERFVGRADLDNLFRRPFGPGWALVGDAGYHRDPITAQGITDAFRDAELLAEAIDAGLSGREDLQESLAGYERRRNEAVMPMFDLTCQLASLGPPPPEMLQLFAALREDSEATNRFLGAVAGTVPIPEFFSPESVGRLIGAAQVAGSVMSA